MPLYRFSCPTCGAFDAAYPMAEVPTSVDCMCGAPARRRITAPRLARSGTAMRLLDATESTADRPAVVSSVPGSRASASTSGNPLHAKLPRP